MRENTDVSGLAVSADKSCVEGIYAGGELLCCDLVVDTTGRGSRTPQWLEAMGYRKPQEERVEVGLSYTTRLFRRNPQELNGDLVVVIPPTPSGKRGGVMLAQENSYWTVTLVSHFGPSAPGELDGFIEYTKSLPAPYIHEVVRFAEPIGDPCHLTVSGERPTSI